MNITEKLLEARKMIKETSIQKEGTNTFSKYNYFTPSQVSELVNTVCQDLGIITLFSLEKDEYGLYGKLRIVSVERSGTIQITAKEKPQPEPEFLEFVMYTEMPSIKATNETQQMGGCETYTKRYMLMSAFDITDNNLDFDSQDNRPKAPVQVPKLDANVELDIIGCNTLEELERFYMAFDTDEKKLYKTLIDDHKLKLKNK